MIVFFLKGSNIEKGGVGEGENSFHHRSVARGRGVFDKSLESFAREDVFNLGSLKHGINMPSRLSC